MVNVIKIATTCKKNNDYSAVFFSLGTVVKKQKILMHPGVFQSRIKEIHLGAWTLSTGEEGGDGKPLKVLKLKST